MIARTMEVYRIKYAHIFFVSHSYLFSGGNPSRAGIFIGNVEFNSPISVFSVHKIQTRNLI